MTSPDRLLHRLLLWQLSWAGVWLGQLHLPNWSLLSERHTKSQRVQVWTRHIQQPDWTRHATQLPAVSTRVLLPGPWSLRAPGTMHGWVCVYFMSMVFFVLVVPFKRVMATSSCSTALLSLSCLTAPVASCPLHLSSSASLTSLSHLSHVSLPVLILAGPFSYRRAVSQMV